MKIAFKSAFKEMSQKHPIYGLNTGLGSPNQWWTELISKSLLSSGIPSHTVNVVMPTLGPNLLHRFSTMQAYQFAEGVPIIFQLLIEMKKEAKEKGRELDWNLATNSDARILSVCQSLGLDSFQLNCTQSIGQRGTKDYSPPPQVEKMPRNPSLTSHQEGSSTTTTLSEPSLSYFLGYEKPHATFFHKAVQQSRLKKPSSSSPTSLSDYCAQTLYVGDDLKEDYIGARQAGLQAVWLQRSQPWPNGLSDSEKEQVVAVTSMEDVADIIRQSWSS